MLLLALLTLATLLAIFIKRRYTYWQRKGFPTELPKIPFGCLESVIKRQRSFGMAIYDVYKNNIDKVVGIYLMQRPALLVRDAELAKSMLVQDFPSFHDRGVYVDEKNDQFSGNLFALQGDRWKALRTKLAPSFSSGKLKGIFGTTVDVGDKMVDYLNKHIPDDGHTSFELRDLFSKYSVDIIASSIFGLEVNSFEDPLNRFRKISFEFNQPTLYNVLRGTAVFLCPSLEKFFIRLGFPGIANKSMKKVVRETIEFREKNNIVRKDLMQMLIQIRNTGKINLDDNIWEAQSSADGFKSMSIDCIAGQAALFYTAGFDTTASAAAFTLYELAMNSEVLAKVQEDIDQAIAKHDGQITYDSIQDMKYLDLCLMETVRKYPSLPLLNRECTKDFKIPGTDLTIERGTPIIISLFGMHRDPEYFPDPMKYDPERFLPSNRNYNPAAYMPFGEGPRHCIAQRMGKMNAKAALAKVLTNFDVKIMKKEEVIVDSFSIAIMPKGGVNVRLSKKTNVAKH